MGVYKIESEQAFTEALNKHIVVVDCFAEWCGPCKVIAPVVEKLSAKFTNVHFIKLDVDELPEVAQELGVTAMPTFIVFKGGEKVDSVIGANPGALEKSIEKVAGPQSAPSVP